MAALRGAVHRVMAAPATTPEVAVHVAAPAAMTVLTRPVAMLRAADADAAKPPVSAAARTSAMNSRAVAPETVGVTAPPAMLVRAMPLPAMAPVPAPRVAIVRVRIPRVAVPTAVVRGATARRVQSV
ncbi:hypothetical protein AB9U18_25350, partial [Novosphingobium sp. NRRL B-2648]|uniref:hypothetical protein n=1 Tax=Novosphingobium sp. NRRL B-2648 TaxID=3230802 RepID=UPI003514F812